MDKLDSVLAILVQTLWVIVTLVNNVKKVTDVDQIIVWLHLDLMFTQIVVILPKLEMKIFVQLMNHVKSMKGTVIPMQNVETICIVDLTIVMFH